MSLPSFPPENRPDVTPIAGEVASPKLDAYDRAVLACNSGDFLRAHRAIGLLRASLDFDSSSSRAFDRLFQWCEVAVDRGDYAGASRCLAFLRRAWLTVTTENTQPVRVASERIAPAAGNMMA